MRPSPLILLVIVCAGLALIAFPLVRLTGAPAGGGPALVAAVVRPGEPARVSALLRLRFVHPPDRFSVSQEGREIAAIAAPAANPATFRLSLALPPEGIEWLVDATWPAGTSTTAITVELEPDGYDARSVTLWTDTAAVSEIISFKWP